VLREGGPATGVPQRGTVPEVTVSYAAFINKARPSRTCQGKDGGAARQHLRQSSSTDSIRRDWPSADEMPSLSKIAEFPVARKACGIDKIVARIGLCLLTGAV
jgi:hypothetical protein